MCFFGEHNVHHLVGGFNHLENMQVSWDDYSQYMENKKCSKPPTRQCSSSNNTSKHIMTHHDTPYASGHIMTDQETS